MRHTIALTVALSMLALAGCDDEVIVVSNRGMGPADPGPGPGQAVGEEAPDAGAGPEVPQYRDEDFVEANENRDPFHNYAALFQAQAPTSSEVTRDVIMSDTGVEEMRVIGIVTGVADPRAMIVDRDGVGHTVRRGDWLGRNEVVQAGGTEELPVTLNWRVERIRANQVVLTREDPTAPNRPPLTRVLPLRDEQEEAALGGVRLLDDGRAR